jgi:hypothetical protein
MHKSGLLDAPADERTYEVLLSLQATRASAMQNQAESGTPVSIFTTRCINPILHVAFGTRMLTGLVARAGQPLCICVLPPPPRTADTRSQAGPERADGGACRTPKTHVVLPRALGRRLPKGTNPRPQPISPSAIFPVRQRRLRPKLRV